MKLFLKLAVKGIAFMIFVAYLNICPVEAASQTQLYADDVEIKAGECAKIPVYIKNNPGIMGYVIRVEYDSEKLRIKEISAGDLSVNGVFDHNLSLKKKDKVEILWSYTKEIKKDGILFFLDVKAEKKLNNDKTHMHFRCLQEDTFNEKYQPVNILCKPIQIKGRKNTARGEKSRSDNDIEEKDNEKVDAGGMESAETKTDDIETGKQKKNEHEQSGNIKNKLKKEQEQDRPVTETEKSERDNKEGKTQAEETPETINGRSIKIEEIIKKKGNANVAETVSSKKKSKVKGWIVIVGGLCALIVAGFLLLKRKKSL